MANCALTENIILISHHTLCVFNTRLSIPHALALTAIFSHNGSPLSNCLILAAVPDYWIRVFRSRWRQVVYCPTHCRLLKIVFPWTLHEFHILLPDFVTGIKAPTTGPIGFSDWLTCMAACLWRVLGNLGSQSSILLPSVCRGDGVCCWVCVKFKCYLCFIFVLYGTFCGEIMY